MAELHTFWISSRTGGVTQNVDIVWLSLNPWCTLSFACLDDASKSVKFNVNLCTKLLQIGSDLTSSRVDDDQVLDHGCLARLLHLKDLFSVVFCADNSLHLGLSEDKVHLLDTHSIVETNSRHLKEHASNECLSPFSPVLRPDTHESPHAALALNLRNELLGHQTTSEVLDVLVDLSVGFPLILAKHRVSLLVGSDLWARPQESLITTVRDLPLETLDDCRVGVALRHVGLRLQVVVVLSRSRNVYQFAAVACLGWLIVIAPLGVLHSSLLTVAGGIGFDHNSERVLV